MDKQEFTKLLTRAGINKKELSEISGIPYQTINAWGSTNPYPPYVRFMLESYIKAKDFEKMLELLKPYFSK